MSDPPPVPPTPPTPPSPPITPPPTPPPLPSLPAAERVRIAYQRRPETDYVFSFWTALGWTVLTCGIFGYYVVYQLVRRMREHNRRRLDLLEASIGFAWEQAQRRPAVADELRPTFESMAGNLGVLRQMTSDFRDPAVWTLLAFLTGGIATVVAFVLLDGDLVRHTAAERAVQADLGRVYLRLGQDLGPDEGPADAAVKGRHNYGGRIAASLASFGIYLLWWYRDVMVEANRHFAEDWAWEDRLGAAVYYLAHPS
ncbi:MAG: hypothetical protein QOH36_302 [Actinomycetota bacterium]|nr:hypothetical protein [Actinomycetota bacterium]